MRNYGFVPPTIESDHYMLGAELSLPKIILQSNRRWAEFAPDYEAQAEKYETYGCPFYGSMNAIETLERRIFGEKSNYAEAFNYTLSGVTGPSDPHKALENMRKNGLIDQSFLPMPETYEEFCNPERITPKMIEIGKSWVKKRELGHQWVFANSVSDELRKSLIREELQYSPLGISVTAWHKDKGIYVDLGLPNNHWCVLLEEVAEGWLVLDTYDGSFKVVSFSHNIQYCKRYSLNKRGIYTQQTFIQRLLAMLKLTP